MAGYMVLLPEDESFAGGAYEVSVVYYFAYRLSAGSGRYHRGETAAVSSANLWLPPTIR